MRTSASVTSRDVLLRPEHFHSSGQPHLTLPGLVMHLQVGECSCGRAQTFLPHSPSLSLPASLRHTFLRLPLCSGLQCSGSGLPTQRAFWQQKLQLETKAWAHFAKEFRVPAARSWLRQ